MSEAIGLEKLLTGKEAAALMHVTETTLARWRRDQGIAHYKVGGRILYKAEDLYDFLERQRVEARKAKRR